MKLAAGVFLQNSEGKVLALCGPKHGPGYDLPFGKVESGESGVEAAARECFEETGIAPTLSTMVEIYAAEANGFWAQTYLCTRYAGELKPPGVEGTPEWVDSERLLMGTYGAYNAGVLKAVLKLNSPERVSWDQYFMGLARAVATRSTCLRVPNGIGCVLVKDKRILATGYTGSIAGQPHCTEVGCLMDNGGCVRTVHAEQNAILQAAQSLNGVTCYTTMSPCWVCFKLLVGAGVNTIIYGTEYRLVERQREFAKLCSITFRQVV